MLKLKHGRKIMIFLKALLIIIIGVKSFEFLCLYDTMLVFIQMKWQNACEVTFHAAPRFPHHRNHRALKGVLRLQVEADEAFEVSVC